MLYKPLICFNSNYISNKMEHFNYKGGCSIHGHMHIETFKGSAS